MSLVPFCSTAVALVTAVPAPGGAGTSCVEVATTREPVVVAPVTARVVDEDRELPDTAPEAVTAPGVVIDEALSAPDAEIDPVATDPEVTAPVVVRAPTSARPATFRRPAWMRPDTFRPPVMLIVPVAGCQKFSVVPA